MRNRARLITFAAAALIAVCAAGCSDDESLRRDYIREARAIERDLIDGAMQNSSEATLAPDGPAKQLAALDDIIARFTALEPPSDWRDEHKRVVESLTKLRVSIKQLDTAMKAEDLAGVKAMLRLSQEAGAELDDALSDMRRDSQR